MIALIFLGRKAVGNFEPKKTSPARGRKHPETAASFLDRVSDQSHRVCCLPKDTIELIEKQPTGSARFLSRAQQQWRQKRRTRRAVEG